MTNNTTPSRPPPLPVFATLVNAMAFLWARRTEFLNLSFPAVLCLGVLNTLIALWLRDGEATESAAEMGALALAARGAVAPMLVVLLVGLYFWTTFAVAWLRLVLLPKDQQSPIEMLRWSRRHTRFMGYTLGLLAMVGFISVFGLTFVSGLAQTQGAPAQGLWLLVLVGTVLVYARFSQVLPAAAIEHGLRFNESWYLTRGQTGRLLGLFAAALVVPGLIMSGLQGVLVSLLDGSTSFMGLFVRAFVGNLLNYVGLAYLVTVLSLVYDHLLIRRPPSVDLTVS